jgi:hypothetical protein
MDSWLVDTMTFCHDSVRRRRDDDGQPFELPSKTAATAMAMQRHIRRVEESLSNR